MMRVQGSSSFRRAFATRKPELMSNSEAFVETLAAYKVENCFGIVGSAFMDALDLFPRAGIRFISTQHEQGAAHMADGYARASGKTGFCIAQNGPGITNFVTGVGAAMGAHSPVVCVTPEAGTLTKGHGGFQEVDQLPLFSTITKAQYHVNHPARMAEFTDLAFSSAQRLRGPVQLNIPRDYFYGEQKFAIPEPADVSLQRVAGNPTQLRKAAELLAGAKNPVILAGGGVVMANAQEETKKLAEMFGCPVAVTYLHNDAFPCDHPLFVGPLGYQGSKAAMSLIKDADVVLALGTRLGPFGTLPQYGEAYWPENAKIIQVELDQEKVGRVKACDVGIAGDAKLAAQELLELCAQKGVQKSDRPEIRAAQQMWEKELEQRTQAGENGSVNDKLEGQMIPRQALRELQKAMPDNAMVATDIGNICSVSNSYLNFKQPNSFFAAMTFGNCGYALPAAMGAKIARPDRPAISYAGDGAWGMSFMELMTCMREGIPVTPVVFNNRQWGAEKKNQVLWFGDRYVGTNFTNPPQGWAGIAKAMGVEGIQIAHADQVGDAFKKALQLQSEGKTCVLELMVNRELGDPFRRDAMKLPVRKLAKYADFTETAESATGQPVDVSEQR